MSHLAVRYFLVGLVAAAAVATGGSAMQASDQAESEAAAPMRTATALSMVNPTELHGEIPSANREQQRLTLGSGECLEAAVEKTVKQLDPVMNTQQVTSTVAVLMNDIQAEAPTANLRTVSPGVSVLIVRQRTATGVVWDAVLGKYSGIT